jgi:predicted protein tyrosine phosphatase
MLKTVQGKYCAHYSRMEIENVSIPRGAALISIRDPWREQGYLPPQADHAGEIARFVREHRDRTIIVHCEMGLSRSAAVCDVLVALGWEYVATRSEGRRLANRRLVQLLQRQLVDSWSG